MLRKSPGFILIQAILGWIFELNEQQTTRRTQQSYINDQALGERLTLSSIAISRNFAPSSEVHSTPQYETGVVEKLDIFPPGVVATFVGLLAVGTFTEKGNNNKPQPIMVNSELSSKETKFQALCDNLLLRDTSMVSVFIRMLRWWENTGMVCLNEEGGQASGNPTTAMLSLWLSSSTLASFLNSEEDDESLISKSSPFSIISQWPCLCSTLVKIGAVMPLDSFGTGFPPIKLTIRFRRLYHDDSSINSANDCETERFNHSDDECSCMFEPVVDGGCAGNDSFVRIPYLPNVYSFVLQCLEQLNRDLRPVVPDAQYWRSLINESIKTILDIQSDSPAKNRAVDLLQEVSQSVGIYCHNLINILVQTSNNPSKSKQFARIRADAFAVLFHATADFLTAVALLRDSGTIDAYKRVEVNLPITNDVEIERLLAIKLLEAGSDTWAWCDMRPHVELTIFIDTATFMVLKDNNWIIALKDSFVPP